MNSKIASRDHRTRRPTLILLIVATVVYLLSLAPWFVMYTVVLFGGQALPLYVLLVYPVVVVVSLVAGWIFYRKRRDRAARWSAALPLIHILIFGLAVAWTVAAARHS